MGLFDFFRRSHLQAEVKIGSSDTEQKLTYVEKERILVNQVTTEDMLQFSEMPYDLHYRVKKFMPDNGHPFAYMDLVEKNVTIAKSELSKMNEQLSKDTALSRAIPKELSIPIQDILFRPLKDSGYTRLMCTPFSSTGQISKYPVSLSFMTDLRNDINTTHGDLFYGQDGSVKKATIYFWRNRNGWFFYYDTVEDKLALSRVEVPDMQGQRNVVYKGKHLLEREAQLLQEEKDFIWLQKNLPCKCPKSLSGFRRMKTQNTKNYQTIVKEATKLGYEIK